MIDRLKRVTAYIFVGSIETTPLWEFLIMSVSNALTVIEFISLSTEFELRFFDRIRSQKKGPSQKEKK